MANALNVKIGGDIRELESAMNRASQAVQNAGKQMTQMGKTLTTRVTAPIMAFNALAVRAFGQQEKAELQLRAALQANGRQVDILFGKYNTFAKEMQRTTVIGDETALSMLAQAEALGLTGEAATRAVKNSIAMQSAFGVNAQSALRYTAALEQGNSTMLARYIPALRELDGETARVAEAQRILGNAFSAAESEAGGTLGKMQQMKNAMGDFMEVVGAVVAESMLPFIDRLKELFENLQNVNPATIRMGVAIAGVAAAIGPLLISLGLLTKALALVLSPIYLKIAAISSLVLAFEYVRRNLDVFINRISRGFAQMRNIVVDEVDKILAAIQEWAFAIPGITELAIIQTRAALKTISDDVPKIEGEFQGLGDFMVSIGQDIGSVFTWLSNMVFPNLGEEGGKAAEKINKPIQSAITNARNFGRAFSEVSNNIQNPVERIREALEKVNQAAAFAKMIADDFTNSFGQGMANVIVQGEKLIDTLKNIGKLLASSIIQKGLSVLLTGGLGGSGFFGAAGGLFGKIFGVNDALITSGGDVVKFHPDDNILAMKDFSNFGGMRDISVRVHGEIRGETIYISGERGGVRYGR